MALTPEKMAEFLAAELVDDMDKLADHLIALEARWSEYGTRYHALLSQEKRADLEDCWRRFHEKTKHLADS